MKLVKQNIYKIFTLLLVVAYSLHTSSCASTKAAPSGGPKDTIPPVVVRTVPSEMAVGFPLEKGEITVLFNEYVQVKDAYKNILLSPPQKKAVKTRIKGKGVVVTFPEPLDSNQTYSLNFGASIVDNNEGNPLFGYSYSFSTGNEIDSLMFSGTIVDAATLFPVENATVALYLNPKDSTVMNELPKAVAKTDKWGYFTVRNIKGVPYTIYAFSDDNNNNKYDQGAEKIAFMENTFIPTEVMHKDSPQLQYYDPKDTLGCLARPSQVELRIFSEKSTNQFIKDYKRHSKRGAYIKFNAADAQIDSFSIAGIKDNQIIRQFNVTKDSLSFWINEPGKIADTLHLGIKYHKTDTAGVLVPFTEKLKLIAPFEKKKDVGNNSQERKDLLKFNISADNKIVEQEGIVLTFPEPLVKKDFDSLSFIMSNPKQIKSNVKYTVEQDSIEINKYVIRPQEQFVKGNDYEIKFPMGIFRDINGFTNDSTKTQITLPNSDNASSIAVEIINVGARYIVELINDTRTKVYRKYIINNDAVLEFPYLEKGKYAIRITEDKNNNGLLDTGDLLKRKQPEKVLLYTLPGGSEIIELNEKTDLEQTIDIKELFGN